MVLYWKLSGCIEKI